jgi:hypothetical protein
MAKYSNEELLQLEPEDWPDKVSRYKRRKKESPGEFRERILEMISSGRLVLKKKAVRKQGNVLHKRTKPTLDVLRFLFGLSEEDISLCGQLDPPNPDLHRFDIPSATREKPPSPTDLDNLGGVRAFMSAWVCDTYGTKISEASCNLYCPRCPSGRLLTCASDNVTPAAESGYDLLQVLLGGRKS